MCADQKDESFYDSGRMNWIVAVLHMNSAVASSGYGHI